MSKLGRPAWPKLDIRFGPLVFVSLLAQLVVVFAGPEGEWRRVVYPASFVLLLVFIVLNRRRIGFLVIGAGMLLNFLAIVANGGLMPVSPSTLVQADLERDLAGIEPGDPVPRTKNVLLEREDTNLWWLSDRLTWGSRRPFPVFSVGDVVVGAGLVVTLAELLLPALRRPSRDRTSVT